MPFMNHDTAAHHPARKHPLSWGDRPDRTASPDSPQQTLYACGAGHHHRIVRGDAVFEALTDVFPVIQIPVNSIVWIYDNLVPAPRSSFSEDQGLGSSFPA